MQLQYERSRQPWCLDLLDLRCRCGGGRQVWGVSRRGLHCRRGHLSKSIRRRLLRRCVRSAIASLIRQQCLLREAGERQDCQHSERKQTDQLTLHMPIIALPAGCGRIQRDCHAVEDEL